MIVFDGKKESLKKEEELKLQISALKMNRPPKVVDIAVEPDPATQIYMRLKQQAALRVGINMEVVLFDDLSTSREITDKIGQLNMDDSVDGILVQLPLPKRFYTQEHGAIVESIEPKKDVDGIGRKTIFPSATVRGIFEILKIAKVGKNDNILIVGRDGVVGSKLMKYLQIKGHKVAGVDKEIESLRSVTKTADAIISATGVPMLINADMLKQNCVVIDVGAPKGEFIWEGLERKARFATPVPGGVGPMTVVSLLQNTLDALTLKST